MLFTCSLERSVVRPRETTKSRALKACFPAPFGNIRRRNWIRLQPHRGTCPLLCATSSEPPSSSGAGDTAVSEAVDTIKQCINCFTEKQLDQVLSYIPDEVVDFLVDRSRPTKDTAAHQLSFDSVLKVQEQFEDVFKLDTYALRNLVFTAPSSVRVLSSLLMRPDRFVQRCAVTSRYGEECVLTFTLGLQESLQAQYRGVRMCKRWMLRSVVGESDAEDIVSEPMPQASPEAVVAAQLQALRCRNIAGVYAFASPDNKATVGPLERFAVMLSNPYYRPLVGHKGSTTISRIQVNDHRYVEVVLVEPSTSTAGAKPVPPLQYTWVVTRQQEPGAMLGCWMTDSVYVVPTYGGGFLG